HQGSGCHPSPAASVRVFAVLRHLVLSAAVRHPRTKACPERQFFGGASLESSACSSLIEGRTRLPPSASCAWRCVGYRPKTPLKSPLVQGGTTNSLKVTLKHFHSWTA